MNDYFKEKYSNYKLRREGSSLKMAFYDSISMVPDEQWDALKDNIYLTHSYLVSIEEVHERNIAFRYVLFYKNGEVVGKAAFQLVDVRF